MIKIVLVSSHVINASSPVQVVELHRSVVAGDNKLMARNAAAEQAIRDLIIKKMNKAVNSDAGEYTLLYLYTYMHSSIYSLRGGQRRINNTVIVESSVY